LDEIAKYKYRFLINFFVASPVIGSYSWPPGAAMAAWLVSLREVSPCFISIRSGILLGRVSQAADESQMSDVSGLSGIVDTNARKIWKLDPITINTQLLRCPYQHAPSALRNLVTMTISVVAVDVTAKFITAVGRVGRIQKTQMNPYRVYTVSNMECCIPTAIGQNTA
jgi:hypothetical protein